MGNRSRMDRAAVTNKAYHASSRKNAGGPCARRRQTLRDLQRDGLVTRRVYPTQPPSVEYGLTALGASLLDPLTGLVTWAEARKHEINNCAAFDDRAA
jgi:hypothetical protein